MSIFQGFFFTRGKTCEEAARERGWHGGQTRLCNLSRFLVTWFLLTLVKTGCFLPLPCRIRGQIYPSSAADYTCLFAVDENTEECLPSSPFHLGCAYVTGRRVLNVLCADVIKIPYRANCWRVSCSFRTEQPDWVFRQCILGQWCWQAAR